jgi:signal transduction histidine kinase
MISLKDQYRFIESNFEYLLAISESEEIIYISKALTLAGFTAQQQICGEQLSKLLSSSSVGSFRSSIVLHNEGNCRYAVFSPRENPKIRILLRAGNLKTGVGLLYLFFGTQIDSLRHESDTSDDHTNELACLYSIAEWIEISESIEEFFTRLPELLVVGMQHPEQAIVSSIFKGKRYGSMPETISVIKVNLVLDGEIHGHIKVGYQNDEFDLLPEENKMLLEIGRVLNFVLARREVTTKLSVKNIEFEEMRGKLKRADKKFDQLSSDWRESKSRLETLFAAVPGDVVLIDQDYSLVMSNNKKFKTGSLCYNAIFDRESPCENCRLDIVMSSQTPVTQNIKREGKHLRVNAMPVFDKDHNVDGIIEFYRDFTLQKTYEKQLRQADKLASLGQMVSGIGHEINNPNQFIQGNIKIVKQAFEDMLPIVDKHREINTDLKIARLPYDYFRSQILTLVDDMAHGSTRIKEIVSGLRDFAQPDEGDLEDRVDVNKLIKTAIRLVGNDVRKQAIIDLQLDPHLPYFTGNSQKIEQVLINLIVNASQAMPNAYRGKIIVSTTSNAEFVVIKVIDDAKGMSEETRKQMFDPFFTTKRGKGGTGLGLSISYRIIEEHRGNIEVNTKLGLGTTFTISIPRDTELHKQD